MAEISRDWKNVEQVGNKFVEGPVRKKLFYGKGTIEENGTIDGNGESQTI